MTAGTIIPDLPKVEEIPKECPENMESQRVVRKASNLLLARSKESLRLYEPLPIAEQFHASGAPERILRGSNRSGKTLASALEIARALTGQDPYHKYPETDGRCFIVGMDGKHNAEVLFRKLFRPNAFRIIRDNTTNLWRTWRPWQDDDLTRKRESKPSRPLVPSYMVKTYSWENKAEGVPNLVRLHNGWEARFFSSLGTPPQGSDVDLVWMDEEIVNCLAGWSLVYDPVDKLHRRVDQIEQPFHVWSFNENSQSYEIRAAMKPFVKAFGEIIAARLSNGCTIYGTRQHRVLLVDGRWASLQEACSQRLPLSRSPESAAPCDGCRGNSSPRHSPTSCARRANAG